MKQATIKLLSSIGISGELIKRGTIITIGEDAAKDLLRRGKAEMATEDDEPEAVAEPEGEDEGDSEEAAATGKKKK